MTCRFVQVGDARFINVDRVTHVEPMRGGRLRVRFSVGNGQHSEMRDAELSADEGDLLLAWLYANCEPPVGEGE